MAGGNLLTLGRGIVGELQFSEMVGNDSDLALAGILQGTASITPTAALAAGAVASMAVTVTGVLATDMVIVEPPSALEATLAYQGVIVTANTITVLIANRSSGAVTGAARTWVYKILRVHAGS